MKKIYFLLATMLFSGAAMAQSTKFGFKAGANFANNIYSGNGLDISVSSVTSFHAGGFITLGLAKKMALQPELLISGQGAKFEGASDNTLYLNVPVMFKYNAVAGLSFEAGPQIGLLLSAKTKVDSVSFDDKESYNTFDFGANVGAEYALPTGLLFNARYTLGLANIAKNFVGLAVKNTVFSLGVGYRF
ncbi:PorT family protein [Solitalea sp. MAHUQ-68]|uniref:PorT family protein n=1 Tax=Solitalea agri TaxID=2953739 RepID=A0A9X2EZU0_9SPHI|nr:porin family protein [Solitalea agri]MCO4291470.1 PorT family protein [Solitalea agri]